MNENAVAAVGLVKPINKAELGVALEERALGLLAMLGPQPEDNPEPHSRRLLGEISTIKPEDIVCGVFIAVVKNNSNGMEGFNLSGGFIGTPSQLEAIEMVIRGRRIQSEAQMASLTQGQAEGSA